MHFRANLRWKQQLVSSWRFGLGFCKGLSLHYVPVQAGAGHSRFVCLPLALQLFFRQQDLSLSFDHDSTEHSFLVDESWVATWRSQTPNRMSIKHGHKVCHRKWFHVSVNQASTTTLCSSLFETCDSNPWVPWLMPSSLAPNPRIVVLIEFYYVHRQNCLRTARQTQRNFFPVGLSHRKNMVRWFPGSLGRMPRLTCCSWEGMSPGSPDPDLQRYPFFWSQEYNLPDGASPAECALKHKERTGVAGQTWASK